MAKWQRSLKLNPEWEQCQSGEISRQELAASIARKLKAMRPLPPSDYDAEREELADVFEDMAEDGDLSEDEFNGVMHDLYDWGDTPLDDNWNGKKVCWVDVLSP